MEPDLECGVPDANDTVENDGPAMDILKSVDPDFYAKVKASIIRSPNAAKNNKAIASQARKRAWDTTSDSLRSRCRAHVEEMNRDIPRYVAIRTVFSLPI